MTTPFGRSSGTRYGTASDRVVAEFDVRGFDGAARRAGDVAGQCDTHTRNEDRHGAGRAAWPRAGHRRRHIGPNLELHHFRSAPPWRSALAHSAHGCEHDARYNSGQHPDPRRRVRPRLQGEPQKRQPAEAPCAKSTATVTAAPSKPHTQSAELDVWDSPRRRGWPR